MQENLKKLLGLPNVEPVRSVDQAQIGTGDIIMLGIPREAVERGHLESFLREFEKFGRKKMRSQVMLSFDGYDRDPREVYQIPEIRKWVNRLLANVPHLFYFLTRENYSMRVAYMCLADVAGRQDDQVSLQTQGAKRLIEKISRAAVAFARKQKEPDVVQFAIANTILEELGYDQL